MEESNNPFATVVMAHLKAQETRQDEEERKRWKLYLIRRLYERGYGRKDVVQLFRFIDWVLQLPEEVEEMVWQKAREYEAEQHRPYITSVERIGYRQGKQEGIQQGVRQGLLAGIELGLKLKFDGQGVRLLPEIHQIKDVEVLRAVHNAIETADTVEELRRIYA